MHDDAPEPRQDNLYAPPTATIVDPQLEAANRPTPFYVVSTTKVLVLSLATLGMYTLYWFWRHWKLHFVFESEPNAGTRHLETPWLFNIKRDPKEETDFTLRVRVPGWARNEVVPSDLYRYDDELTPQVGTVLYERGDMFLLCSDGLVEGLYNHQLEELLRSSDFGGHGAGPADRLVQESLARDGRDNLTAVVIRVD